MSELPIKRLRYFTGQFLEATDFETEQAYHIDMRQRGNRALYTGAGVVDGGLQVTRDADATKIVISPGIGVDDLGRELVLVDPMTATLPTAAQDSERWVTLEYMAAPTDEQVPNDGAVNDTTRYEERPQVHFPLVGPALGPHAVALAKVKVTRDGKLIGDIDTAARRKASGGFCGNLTIGQGSNGVLHTRHIDGKGFRGDSSDDLFLNWGTGKNVQVGTMGSMASSLLVSGKLGIGTGAPGALLSIVRPGATEIQGTALSDALRVSGGALGSAVDSSIPLANIGFRSNATAQSNNVSLGIRAHRHTVGDNWNTTRVGLSLDVDDTPAAGPTLWLRAPQQNVPPRVEISGGALMPTAGNTDWSGILFPSDPGRGGGDKAWIRYYARTPRPGTNDTAERTALELGTANDELGDPANQDDILLMPSGGVGVGVANPQAKLHVAGGSGQTAIKADGYISFSGASNPAANAAFRNVLTPSSLVKAWGQAFYSATTGAVLRSGFNIAKVEIVAGALSVTLADDSSVGYRCVIVSGGSAAYIYVLPDTFLAANPFRIEAYEPQGNKVDLSTRGGSIGFVVLAVQQIP